jgi:hypothetical protein
MVGVLASLMSRRSKDCHIMGCDICMQNHVIDGGTPTVGRLFEGLSPLTATWPQSPRLLSSLCIFGLGLFVQLLKSRSLISRNGDTLQIPKS